MSILLEEDLKLELPKMFKIKQKFPDVRLFNVEDAVKEQFNKPDIISKIKPGQKIAVAVGSRGIKNLLSIVKVTVELIKEIGGMPFIVSAMGSHGAGTEQGQRQILESYGITEENLGISILTTVDVEKIGKTSKGTDVYFDKAALGADLVIPINRVKLHTDFVGEIQSGLCKMLVIGLGNQIGCSSIHEENLDVFSNIIEEAASIIINNVNVGFGIAIIENGYDETAMIEFLPSENIISREKELLKIAKNFMPTLMIPEIDVLIVNEIGKNISGAGFDPNILGKSAILKKFVLKVPNIKRMVLLDITEESHGNGIGVGMFDIITRKVFNKLDLDPMYTNAIASKVIEDVKIPLITDTEEEAIKVAIKACRNLDKANLKIVKIKNTLELEHIEVSETLLDYARSSKNFIV